MILHLGCGTGLSGIEFKPLAKQLIGIDLSEKMIAHAKQKNIYDQLHVSDINAYLENHHENYDLIIAADVFVYIGDLATVFKLCKRRLKDQGLFAFSVEKEEGNHYHLQDTARFAHSEHYIQSLAKEMGYRIEMQSTIIARLQEDKDIEA